LAILVLGNFWREVQQNPPLLWIVAAAALLKFDSVDVARFWRSQSGSKISHWESVNFFIEDH
jgi:hypothetical protein